MSILNAIQLSAKGIYVEDEVLGFVCPEETENTPSSREASESKTFCLN